MGNISVVQPHSPEGVCQALADAYGKAVLHAGGTDLLVRLRNKDISPEVIVDLSRLKSHKSIARLPHGGIRIGCMATITDLIKNSGLKGDYEALCDGLNVLGSAQIRNRATMVGNICNASPSADTAPPLLVLGAEVNIRGQQNNRTVPLDQFFVGPGETVLAYDEFVESVDLPPMRSRCGSAYIRIGRRNAVDCAIVGVAVRVGDDETVRAAFGAVGPKPFRAYQAEEMLEGKEWEPAFIEECGRMLLSIISPITDVRASETYRREMAVVLFERAFQIGRNRLKQSFR